MFKIITPIGFNNMVDGGRVASQIATLLNNNNNLYKEHNGYTISNSGCLYIVYMIHTEVVGTTCIQIEEQGLTRNKHTSVDPLFRRRGIGRILVSEAINNCQTRNMYVTIRETNHPSIGLYSSFGFSFVKCYDNNGNKIIVLGRRIK